MAKEGWARKTLQAPWPLHHKECAVERKKSKMWCYLGQASFQRPCFHFFPKLTFLKQVLLIGFLIKLLFGVSHIHFFKLVCLQAQLRSGIVYFRPSGVWKAGGCHSEISSCRRSMEGM